ncbi:polyprotein [Benevides virus]|uniref:Envelopment polyprotein n=1 Tax=Benevides virus TaxID=2748202 RepID=A0A7D9MVZ6_9VIRU|nr:polyprotein [Benevides virus]
MIAYILYIVLSVAHSVPIDNRCFADGVVSMTKQMDHGIAEICIKDDISMIKTTSTQIRNSSIHLNTVYRKMLIQNYEQCNPIETANGPIMIFKPNDDMMLIPHTFACRVTCSISLDETEANIILHSEKLNHYEVMGTTTANRWFQGTTSYSLEHTCEHIQVTCGSTSLSFHACFKYHMACIRLLNKSYMPAFMIQSVCQNKELILMTCLVLIIFGILYIMTLTYICYILIPIFYPITYIYGIIYNKSCKKCTYCGLAYHPLTKCGNNCVCGCMFENSERMKKHRESGLCRGYKSLRAARILCKNRGSSLILAIILSTLLLSFIQPIEGVIVKYENKTLELEEVADEFYDLYNKLTLSQVNSIAISIITALTIASLSLCLVFKKRIVNYFFKRIIYDCPECDMTHPKRDLTFFGDFTNKCNTCMCGANFNYVPDGDYVEPINHKKTRQCYIPGKYYAIRKVNFIMYKVIFAVLILILIVSGANATDSCEKFLNNPNINDPIKCSVWYKLPTSCTGTGNWEEIFKAFKVSKVDLAAAKELPSGLEEMLLKSERSETPINSFLLETSALKMHCNELSEARKKTGKLNKSLGKAVEKAQLEICTTGKLLDLCRCMQNGENCPSSTTVTNAVAFYKNNKQIFKDDITKVLNAIIKVYPGILARELGISLKSSNFSKTKELATKMSNKFGQATAANSCFFFLQKMLEETDLQNIPPHIPISREVLPYATEKPVTPFSSMAEGTAIKECKNKKMFKCSYLIASRFRYLITCNSNDNVFYDVPDEGLASKYNEVTTLCIGDPFCDLDFTPVPVAEKDDLSALICKEEHSFNFDFSKYNPKGKCHKMSTQTCLYKGKNITVVECPNGFFYEYEKLYQAQGEDIGVYCFRQDCRDNVTPHNVKNLGNCILHTSNLENRKLKEIVYENIEQLKHSLQETIKTDLVEHKYKLTMNLPKMTPSFRSLSIMGTETDSGVESAYIETNIIAKTGVSTGITLTTKKGEKLFDIILFIKTGHYEATANLVYETGPTVGINVQHDEQCTGSCPQNLKKEAWLSFSREHTSVWGCEEFGCLAINDGCLFGHCQDIIKPELQVYKRDNNEQPKISLCVSVSEDTYCHDIDSFNPIITDKLEIQFLSNEAGKIPKIFGYKSNKVLTGMINDRGTFSKMCGSVQSFGKKVWGAGNVKFDYICHAARRKDITVSRCFDNFYEACSNLNPEENIVFDDKTNKVQLLNRIMGEMRIKVKLGDIRYKVFEVNPSIDVKATCVGCLKCVKGVDCELSIVSSSETVCPISSNCILYTNNIRIDPVKQLYGIKAKCEDASVTFTVCKEEVSAQISIIDKGETIEVGNSDQTYFVKEKDIRCGTWICKISEQGISSIFAPFISIFGSYGKIAFYTILAIICLALLCFLMLPICVRFKDILQHNEIEYIKENFGYKPLNRRN